MPIREPFNPERPLIAARDFRFGGVDYKEGDAFPFDPGKRRLIERQFEVRAIRHDDASASVVDNVGEGELITMTGPKGGRYEITAPWMDQPLVIRGKVKAEQALAELRAEGPPEDWTDPNGPNSQTDGKSAQEAGSGNPNKSESETGGTEAPGGEGGETGAAESGGAEGGAGPAGDPAAA